jgi:hypothetical protein
MQKLSKSDGQKKHVFTRNQSYSFSLSAYPGVFTTRIAFNAHGVVDMALD